MILGIDYGLRHIGLATSEGEIAEPFETIQVKDISSAIKEIGRRVEKLGIDKIVIGVSEGKSKIRTISFGKKLGKMLQLPIEYADETLTTMEANSLSKRSKSGREQEHTRAAAIILQRFLDEKS